jgi:hypothetical protein
VAISGFFFFFFLLLEERFIAGDKGWVIKYVVEVRSSS